jgi:molybdopterin/thiamine biosynthesis adenylyltransferase
MAKDYHARQDLVLDAQTGAKIKKTKVLVVGAGAGGNELLKNLALMGFGNFTIVDFDTIEASNLSRTTLFSKEDINCSKADTAAEVLRKVSLHESPVVDAYNAKIQDIGKQILLDADIVVCCADTNNARAYLSDWCVRLKKPFFEMGFDGFIIQITFFPNEFSTDSCLREVIGYGDFSGNRHSCSKLKMDDQKLVHIPTIQVAAAFAGVFVATEIVLYLQGNSRLKNRMLQYSAAFHICTVFDVPQSKKCFIHRDNPQKIVNSTLTKEATVYELLIYTKDAEHEECHLRFDDDFVLSIECESCGKPLVISKLMMEMYDKDRWCKECLSKDMYRKDLPIGTNWNKVRELNLIKQSHADYLKMKLSDFNIKNRDMVSLESINDLSTSFLVKIN